MTSRFALAPALVFFASFVSGELIAAPTITSFTPTSAKLTTPVTITGTGFASPATVAFNGVVSSSATVNSATSIVAVVPSAGTTGPITVTVPGGTVTSSAVFTVVPGVVASPSTVGAPGTSTTIYFSSFGAYETVDLYFDTTDLALSGTTGAGAGNLPVTIPATATPGVHWITAVGRKSGDFAQTSFTVRTDWPQLGFRPNHRGRDAFENVISPDNVDQLDEAWRFQSPYAAESASADVGGTIYQGFSDGTVHAFNESTGVQKWVYQTGGGAGFSSPAVINGIVYIGSSDDYLYALDANTGALKWRYLTGGAVWSSPTVKGGIVYFGSFDYNIYAVNAATGALVWKYATGNDVFSSPAVWGGMVFVGSYDQKVYALNAATGAMVWSYMTGSSIVGSPVVIGSTVYIGSEDHYMYAFKAQSGVVRWKYMTGSAITGSAAFTNGTLYFGSFDGKAYALAAATGTLRWSFTSPTGLAVRQNACVANGVVYIGDDENTFALDAAYGGLYTTLPVGIDYGGPIVVNGALTIGDGDAGGLVHYTLTAAQNEATSARPDPATLRHHRLR